MAIGITQTITKLTETTTPNVTMAMNQAIVNLLCRGSDLYQCETSQQRSPE